MRKIPIGYYYTESHEWVSVSGSEVKIGITDFAVEQMNKDIVAVELPAVGASFSQGDVFGVIDSVKAAFDLYSPVGFTVTEVNQKVLDDPTPIAESPYEDGWFVKGTISNPVELDKLMNHIAYQELLKKEEH